MSLSFDIYFRIKWLTLSIIHISFYHFKIRWIYQLEEFINKLENFSKPPPTPDVFFVFAEATYFPHSLKTECEPLMRPINSVTILVPNLKDLSITYFSTFFTDLWKDIFFTFQHIAPYQPVQTHFILILWNKTLLTSLSTFRSFPCG